MRAAAFGAMFGTAALLVAVYYVIALSAAILQYVGWWKVFAKAGQPGWKCLIPFYNGHIMYTLVWKPVYYWVTVVSSFVIASLVSVWSIIGAASEEIPVVFTAIVGIVYLVWLVVVVVWAVKFCVKLSRCFGHGGAFAAGLIFLPVVFLLILAFGQEEYLGNPPVQPQSEPQNQEPRNNEPWNT